MSQGCLGMRPYLRSQFSVLKYVERVGFSIENKKFKHLEQELNYESKVIEEHLNIEFNNSTLICI